MVERRPTVSVVLPNYNYARYLDQRLRSLLDQTLGDLELIVVDDGSVDESRDVIARHAIDPRVRTMFFGVNSGRVYQRWNDGAATARGEYLMFAGADDYCDRRLLERLVAAIESKPGVGVAFARSILVRDSGEPFSVAPREGAASWDEDRVAGPSYWLGLLVERNVLPNASAVLMRRDLFEEAGGFRVDLRLVSDWLLWVELASRCRFAYVAEPLNSFRCHAATVREAWRGLDSPHAPSERFLVLEALRRSPGFAGEVREIYARHVAQLLVDAAPRARTRASFRFFWNVYRDSKRHGADLDGALVRLLARHAERAAALRAQ